MGLTGQLLRIVFCVYLSINYLSAQPIDELINKGKWANAKQWLLSNKNQLPDHDYFANHLTLCNLLNEQELGKCYADSLKNTAEFRYNHTVQFTFHWTMARYYLYHQQKNAAHNHAKLAIEQAKASNNIKFIALAYMQMANTLRAYKNEDANLYRQRLQYTHQAVELIPKFKVSDYFYKAKIYQLAALIYYNDAEEDEPAAQNMIKRLNQSTQEIIHITPKHPQIIHNYILIGYAHSKHQIEKSIAAYEKAEALLTDINDLSHGILLHLSASLFNSIDLAYETLYHQTGNQDYLHKALVWAKQRLWLDYDKLNYEGFYFYRRFTDYINPPTEQRIAQLYYKLYRATQNANYLKFALRYAEYLRHKPITQIGAGKTLYSTLGKMVDMENGISSNTTEQFKQTDNLITQPKLIARYLQTNEALVSYFCVNPKGTDTVTFLVELITPKKQQFITLAYTPRELAALPQKMLDGITRDDEDMYSSAAYRAYELFMKPVLAKLHSNTNKLIIIPPVYYNLPLLFEGFITKPEPLQFAQLPYLFDTYNISYAPSFTHFVTFKKQQIPVELVNIWHPDYTHTPYAEITEAVGIEKNIAQFYATHILSYSSKKELAQELLNAPILQVAAHANANFDNMERPKIYTDLTNEDSVLYDIDLEQLTCNNALAVFAACKSSLGNVQYNGVVDGFSRAIFSAGGAGTITALFNVEENVTVETLNLFYKKLGEGISVSEALYQAKKTIKAKFPHPKKWLAFTYSGSNQSFMSTNLHYPQKLFMVSVLIIVSGLVFLVKTKF